MGIEVDLVGCIGWHYCWIALERSVLHDVSRNMIVKIVATESACTNEAVFANGHIPEQVVGRVSCIFQGRNDPWGTLERKF